MIRKFSAFFFVFLFLVNTQSASATTDPLTRPNNKIGIHILFPSELTDAAKLINSSGGQWGYVTIPIQAGDRDLSEWQTFMDQAKALHVIPIIRLATEGDYFTNGSWRKPDEADILDFANFLNSLYWPTQNRYIIIFNETNRDDEWGGNTNPAEYAQLLSYAVTAFKSKNPDFFIISAGMDNAAANSNTAMNEYTYFRQMNYTVPGIFNQIDGFGSHSYANPGFSSPPYAQTSENIASFQYETRLIKSFGINKQLPVFITETGWSKDAVSDDIMANYYTLALSTVWADPNIAAITPFLLHGNGAQFGDFSFFDPNGSPTKTYLAMYNFQKVKGNPALTQTVLGESISQATAKDLPLADFSRDKTEEASPSEKLIIATSPVKTFFKWLLRI